MSQPTDYLVIIQDMTYMYSALEYHKQKYQVMSVNELD